MFNRLRVRFIALSMASLLLVLGVIVGAANLIAYRHVVQEADGILDILAANGGTFPRPEGEDQPWRLPEHELQPRQTPAAGETLPWETPEVAAQSGTDEADDDADDLYDPDDPEDADDLDDPEDADDDMPLDRTDVRRKEMPYESRYFSVVTDEASAVLSVDTGWIAAVDDDDAAEYARAALESGNTRGFLDDYRFLVADTQTGSRVIFLDCGRSLDTFRSFLATSLLTSAGGVLAVFLLILAFSGRVVRPVAESYEKQKRFITDAGHEIKTPLAIIAADADVLETELEGESEWLDDIRLQTRRLADLTNDLVLLSRMEERGDAAQMVDFPLSDVVEETAQSFRSRAVRQRQTFTERIEPMLSLHGDEKAIRQLVGILLDNALKYAPEGGEIDLSLERQGSRAVLSVYNTSAARVPRESCERLFDRFYRADPSRSSATGGHGIGLSIARAIVSAHRGKIRAETADEQSLRVTAVLPLGG